MVLKFLNESLSSRLDQGNLETTNLKSLEKQQQDLVHGLGTSLKGCSPKKDISFFCEGYSSDLGSLHLSTLRVRLLVGTSNLQIVFRHRVICK